VPRELLRVTAERCCKDAKLQYNLLTDATCVDRYPAEPRFELNYHLVSIPRREKVRLRVWLGGNDPVVDSLVPVWPGANCSSGKFSISLGFVLQGTPTCGAFCFPMIGKVIPCAEIIPWRATETYRTRENCSGRAAHLDNR